MSPGPRHEAGDEVAWPIPLWQRLRAALVPLSAGLGAAFATSVAAELAGLRALGPGWDLGLLPAALACLVLAGRPRPRRLVRLGPLAVAAAATLAVALGVYARNPYRMLAWFEPGVLADYPPGIYQAQRAAEHRPPPGGHRTLTTFANTLPMDGGQPR